MQKGFCVHLLLDPAKLRMPVPDKVQLLRADAVAVLHPALRQVVANQPEYAAWSPSALCLFYLSRVEAGRVRAGDEDPAKAPVLAVWTVTAAGEGSRAERQIALDLRSNDGDLRDAGRDANLELERLYSSIGPVPREDGPPRPGEIRYRVRLGKTVLIWDGRSSEDTTKAPGAVSWAWEAPGHRSGWIQGELSLNPLASTPMVGSLQVEGKDAIAAALKTSPIRFVGQAWLGGDGELRLDR